jgi:hypothetical protein
MGETRKGTVFITSPQLHQRRLDSTWGEIALQEILYRETGFGGEKMSTKDKLVVEKRITFKGHSPELASSVLGKREISQPLVIFLLSPANSSGVRARMLFSPHAESDLAHRLQNSGATLGGVYSFISGLYFRGKLAYAETFKKPPPTIAGVHIITPAAGLLLPDSILTLAELRRITSTRVDPANPHYRKPLDRDLLRLRALLDADTQIVLLGSIATPSTYCRCWRFLGSVCSFQRTLSDGGT